MSRMNVAKSRADKTASKTAQAAATPVTHDIVPGKFTDHDWNLMLERDDSDDFVAELLDELYDNVDRIIYTNYIQSCLIPFTVSKAKDTIVQIIEWQFLVRDEGEIGASGVTGICRPAQVLDGWIPDEEPLPATTDCWAQGAVPKVVLTGRTSLTSELSFVGSDIVSARSHLGAIYEQQHPDKRGDCMDLSNDIKPTNATGLEQDHTVSPNNVKPAQDACRSASASPKLHQMEQDHMVAEQTDGIVRKTEDYACKGASMETEAACSNTLTSNDASQAAVCDTGKFWLPAVPDLGAFLPPDVTESDGGGTADNGHRRNSGSIASNRSQQQPQRNITSAHSVTDAADTPIATSHAERQSTEARSIPSASSQSPATAVCRPKKPKKIQPKNECDSFLAEPEVSAPTCELKSEVANGMADDKMHFSAPITFKKINPSRLPTNQVNTVFCVVDPAAEEAEQRRHNIIKNGLRPPCPPNRKAISATEFGKSPVGHDPFSKHQPSLMETMELSRGVVLREEGRVKKGPKQHAANDKMDVLSSALRQGLQPVRVHHLSSPHHSLSAADLLDRHVPIIKPLAETAPIPPINVSSVTSV